MRDMYIVRQNVKDEMTLHSSSEGAWKMGFKHAALFHEPMKWVTFREGEMEEAVSPYGSFKENGEVYALLEGEVTVELRRLRVQK